MHEGLHGTVLEHSMTRPLFHESCTLLAYVRDTPPRATRAKAWLRNRTLCENERLIDQHMYKGRPEKT